MAAGDNYLKSGRLHDVLLLIQVLAVNDMLYGKTSEQQLQDDWGMKPQSAESWAELVNEHPEFFRLSGDSERRPTLSIRWLSSRMREQPLPYELVGQLMMTAIELHDRQE